MKKATLVSLLGIVIAVMAAAHPVDWKSKTIKLGQIKAGKTTEVLFEFTNKEKTSITITAVKASCGCTKVSFPKTAIEPGKSARISASFRSDKLGSFKKSLKVTTTMSETPIYLYFSGEIIE